MGQWEAFWGRIVFIGEDWVGRWEMFVDDMFEAPCLFAVTQGLSGLKLKPPQTYMASGQRA